MNAMDYWHLFLETGAPEAYLMFSEARKSEVTDVPDYQGLGASCHGLQ